MKTLALALLALSACDLTEPNPHYLGKCIDPVIAEFAQQRGHDACPEAIQAWGTTAAGGTCTYVDLCGKTWQVGGCYLTPDHYCARGAVSVSRANAVVTAGD